MLDFTGKTKVVDSKEFPIVAGSTIAAEGMALINALVDGVEHIKPCNGTDAGAFVGFSYGQTLTPVYKTKVETLTVPATSPYTTSLVNTPVSGQIYIANSVPTEQVAGTPGALSANEYSISGTTITHHAGQAGLVITVTYKYTPTALELMLGDKMMITSFAPSGVTGTMGAILRGEVYTDQFDANAAWSASSTVKLGTAGVLTDTGSGATVTCTVIHPPTVGCPFLGIRF
jgi:hypothetical protein